MVHNGVVSLNNVRFDQIYLMTSNLFQAHVKRDVNLIVISYYNKHLNSIRTVQWNWIPPNK